LLEENNLADEQDTLIDNICQCALLVAAGDGSISEEESEEVDRMRALVEMVFRNRHAIELLEETEDIDNARENRGDTRLIHTLAFGTPSYHLEVIEQIQELQSPEDFISLVKLYAAKIEDPFACKIAAWAAQEVAAIDGLEEGEEKVLQVMANVWGISLKENSRFIERIVGPIISDDVEYSGAPSSDEELLGMAQQLDDMMKEDEGSADSATMAELLGASSMEDLVKKVFDIEELEEYEETEDFPEIFEVLHQSQGDWNEVSRAAEAGVDVNEVVNMQGVAGLSILILAVEQAPLSVIQTLIKAGADINHKLLNFKNPTGYNTALVASLKESGRIDVFDYLLETGADPEPFEDKESGWTPLAIAAKNHNLYAVKTLLKLGVDPNTATSDGETAFKLVCGETDSPESLKCAKALLKSGADPLRLDNEGFAGIHNAVCEGSVDWIKFLIEQADVPVDYSVKSIKGLYSHTPLLIAMRHGNLPVVEYLLTAGADVNARNGEKSIFTSIFSATKANAIDDFDSQIKRFVSLGAKPELSDLLCVLDELEHFDDDADFWCIDFSKVLLSVGSFAADDIHEEDTENIEEMIEIAMVNAPELTQSFLALLSSKNLEIKVVLSDVGKSDIFDQHYQYQNEIQRLYKDRKNAESMKGAIQACRDQIAISEKVIDAFGENNMPLPEHYGYKQLAIILEKQGEFSQVFDSCQQAQDQGWSGDWDKRIKRCEKKK